ncbi:sensor histidine kinase [Sediminibacterium roseum]|uniref:Sensor histidine kinase n=2 Tax=Sediminibacterium roseum TaxID=1978412 RepID=A0ABW9ZWN6_9BACT|nr:sensor histidine kinase [Sediminibacterium roseum]
MRSKSSLYWCCQLGGWLFYGLTMVFFAFIFDNKTNDILYPRIAITILVGLVFTHILRELLVGLNLRPPIIKQKWLLLTVVVLSIIVLFNLANSAVVEWSKKYDPKIKVSVEKRFLYNLILDSPLILVWFSAYYIWHYVELGSKTEIQKARLESLVKELELKTIKSHINPHFIFNALNSIRALVDENPERARTAITALSNILRSSMQAEKLETVPFERELNIVKDYLALEHIRFEDRLRIEYDIDEDTLDQPVPPMMLQTLVENAIKHGIGKQKGGGLVRVISDYRDNNHELIVQNTGQMSAESATSDGFGISSTRNRLKLLFGGKATFAITNTQNDMVEAKVKMPVQEFHV